MDDYHHQPIWPMLQGALDYILNLAGEAWAMLRPPRQTQREQPVSAMTERAHQCEAAEQMGVDTKSANVDKPVEAPRQGAVAG